MRKAIILGIVLLLAMTLSACDSVVTPFELEVEYCTEYPDDVRCDDIEIPNDNDDNNDDTGDTCSEGYILEDGSCVLVVEDTDDPLNCQVGYHEEDGDCVQDQQVLVCDDDYISYNGECLNACELPIDHAQYEPCFVDCYDDTCIYPILTLTGENEYFDLFKLYVKASELKIIDEFELHYILSGETQMYSTKGITFHWCSPWMNCEDLFKVRLDSTFTTGEILYTFDFWYDDSWYGEIRDLRYDVWNEANNEYDTIYISVNVFFIE